MFTASCPFTGHDWNVFFTLSHQDFKHIDEMCSSPELYFHQAAQFQTSQPYLISQTFQPPVFMTLEFHLCAEKK